jgi:hydroxymethylglutaryl-CoA reductase
MATPIANMKSTWANSSIQYDAIGMNVVATAFNANSRVINLKANGNTIFSVDITGNVYCNTTNTLANTANVLYKRNLALTILFS